jgi:mannose-6-phosphate isomerase-like protein (cupin superfamily)
VEKKTWGSETHVVNRNGYCGKLMTLTGLEMCSMHFHVEKVETFHVLTGELLVEFTDPDTGKAYEIRVYEGESLTILPGQPHRFGSGNTDEVCQFVEFSTEDSASDSYRVCPSGSENPWAYLKHPVEEILEEQEQRTFHQGLPGAP